MSAKKVISGHAYIGDNLFIEIVPKKVIKSYVINKILMIFMPKP
jgi:hypothetical protein